MVGIYGMMSQSVVERRRELGIRMALGATVFEAIREATLPGVMLALAGVAAGCLLAGLSAKVFAHLVWGVSTTDPGTYSSVAAGLLLVAALASLLPALRIARLNPADTLREE
jgi:ABC-type antimicrobial peptide transport system permease subunit